MPTYINEENRNYFTENGRCMPKQTITLTQKEASQYPGLKEVKGSVKKQEETKEESQ